MPAHTTVLVIPPMRSRTGQMLGWTKSHAPDCNWALAVEHKLVYGPYHRMPASQVPAHVERCTRCGGGR